MDCGQRRISNCNPRHSHLFADDSITLEVASGHSCESAFAKLDLGATKSNQKLVRRHDFALIESKLLAIYFFFPNTLSTSSSSSLISGYRRLLLGSATYAFTFSQSSAVIARIFLFPPNFIKLQTLCPRLPRQV